MLIGIVADDLTGAADSVAPFARTGYLAGVGLSVSSSTQNPSQDWDVLALNTELRDQDDLKPTVIASVARRATRRLIARAPQVCFKKIDSTLRGHLRPELDGMLRELPDRIAIICPASPANGRTVENGVLNVDGIPLAQTHFVQGTAQPEKFATVRTAFELAEEPTAAEIGLSSLREGIESLETEIAYRAAKGMRSLFCDAVSPDDLRTLAQVVLRQPDRYLPVGSAGFTRAIAESVPGRPAVEAPIWDSAPFTHGRVLVVIGSRHPMSRQQAHRMTGRIGVKAIVLGPEDRWNTLPERQALRALFEAEEMVYLLITPEEPVFMRRHYPLMGVLKMIHAREATPVRVPAFDGYVITGGHTAQEVCLTLGGAELQIFGESAPGIVRAVLLRNAGRPNIPIILKAGGFGDERTLARCVGLE